MAAKAEMESISMAEPAEEATQDISLVPTLAGYYPGSGQRRLIDEKSTLLREITKKSNQG
jgi:hypothetical protein